MKQTGKTDFGRIPSVIRIGVIGHRSVRDPDRAYSAANDLFRQLYTTISLIHRSVGIELLWCSALAEGADQILARAGLDAYAALNDYPAQLRVVLPFSVEKTTSTMRDGNAIVMFRQLRETSVDTKIVPGMSDPEEAFAECGRTVVDDSDIIVALWDGQPSFRKAGTFPTMTYARQSQKRIIQLDENSEYSIQEETTDGSFAYLERIRNTEAYNGILRSDPVTNRQRDLLLAKLQSIDPSAKYSTSPSFEQFRSGLDMMVRADTIAINRARLSRHVADAVQWLSVVAILAVAAQMSLFSGYHFLILFEVVSIFAILIVVTVANRRAWQKRWADYRYLAERLRASLFQLYHYSIIREQVLRPAEHGGPSSEDWVSLFLEWLWLDRSRTSRTTSHLSSMAVKSLWIDSQIRYYDERSQTLFRRDTRMRVAGYVLFTITAAAALLHMFLAPSRLTPVLELLAIVCPAAGAAIVGIRSHREMHNHATRYADSSARLKRLARLIETTSDADALRRILSAVDGILLLEHAEWRTTASTREFGPS